MGRHKKYLTVEDRRIARNKKQKKYRSSTEGQHKRRDEAAGAWAKMARRQGSSTSEQVERFSDESEGDNTPHVMDPVEESARLPESEECVDEEKSSIYVTPSKEDLKRKAMFRFERLNIKQSSRCLTQIIQELEGIAQDANTKMKECFTILDEADSASERYALALEEWSSLSNYEDAMRMELAVYKAGADAVWQVYRDNESYWKLLE